MKEYDKSIEIVLKAIDIGNEHRGDYKLKGKAYQRLGNCYSKLGDYEKGDILL
jgi:tetratricopeptide (TPR) repeat protein